MRAILNTEQIDAHLAQLSGWRLSTDRRAIEKSYTFRDFPSAFAFMTHAAFLAERMNHHPDWSNAFNRVDIRLSTHDVGGLTTLDFGLAQALDGTLPSE